jgi:ERF superfamily.
MKSAAAEVTDLELVEQPRADQPLAVRQETALAEVSAGPLAMAMQAMKAGMSIAEMRDMLNLQKEWEANEARKAFVDDMAKFKKNPPEILKDKHVSFVTSKGTTEYDHATIGNVCDQIIKAAAEYGFSHRWIPSKGEAGELVITCEVTHRLGHIQLTPLEGPRDDSGGKNALQGGQSTRTYLQRHSLLMAFGFATKDQPDDDGRSAASGYDAEGTLQEWADKANAAINLLALNETRKMAGQEFSAAKDVAGWNAFKAVVEAKRAELTGGAA